MTPSDAQARAQSELQSGEIVYWTGCANPGRAALSAVPASIFGIPFAGFALFWMSMAYRGTNALSNSAHNSFANGFRLFPLFGVPFLLMGLAMVLAPLWAFLKGGSTVYAVTNQRVMIISGTTNRSVKSYTPADIISVEHREHPDGSGDIVLLTNAIARSGNNMASQVKVALCGVPNVKQVAQQVLALHSQRSAA